MQCAFDHVHYRVSDVEKTAAFFREHFGGWELRRFEARGLPILAMVVGGQPIMLSPKRPEEQVTADGRTLNYGVYHIAFLVPDVEKAAAALKARGVRFILEPTAVPPSIKMAFVEGPDGIMVEVLERK
ncbi:MAG TPA: VOC family protein [Candidatus Methylomirabilis sp.]|nr:VOC family protein [Candidatus Methylomirabilis sp.]